MPIIHALGREHSHSSDGFHMLPPKNAFFNGQNQNRKKIPLLESQLHEAVIRAGLQKPMFPSPSPFIPLFQESYVCNPALPLFGNHVPVI